MEQGHAAIRAEMEKLIDSNAELVNKTRHTFQSGDTALLIVDWNLSLSTPDGHRIQQSGTATNVLKNDPDVGWRMVWPIHREPHDAIRSNSGQLPQAPFDDQP